jgi:hypothetical protein
MDADDIIKQGREMAGKVRDGAGEQVAQHEDKIKDTLAKLVDFVNDKTGGKYADQVNKAVGYVEQGVNKLAEGHRPGPSTTDDPGAGAAPTSATPPSAPSTPPVAPPAGAQPTGPPPATPPPATPPVAPPPTTPTTPPAPTSPPAPPSPATPTTPPAPTSPPAPPPAEPGTTTRLTPPPSEGATPDADPPARN